LTATVPNTSSAVIATARGVSPQASRHLEQPHRLFEAAQGHLALVGEQEPLARG